MAYGSGTDPTFLELTSGKFIPEMYSLKVIDHVMSNLVIAGLVNTDYQSDLRVGHTVNIPVMSTCTAYAVTPGAEGTVSDAVGSPASITVDQWYQASIETSDFNDIQNQPDYLDAAAKSTAYAIVKQIDTHLGTKFYNLGALTNTGYGSDGQTLTDDIILYLMEYLDEGDVPDDGQRCLIGDPSSKVDLLKIDKFIRNDYVRNPVVATGKFGEIYNMGFYITNNLAEASTGHYGVMMHRDAIGLVIQRNPRSMRIEMPWVWKTKYRTDAIWGCAEIRDTFGMAYFTRKK